MTEDRQETRLDRLWRAVATSDAEADWLRFYEGVAAARLIVPLADATDGAKSRPMTLTLESGEVALAFDTDTRFATFIREPTEFVALTGAALAGSLAPLGFGLALNPAVSPAGTVIEPRAVRWIAEHTGAEVAVGEARHRTALRAPVAPEPSLLEALGTRFAEMAGSVLEAWLVSTPGEDGDEFLCIVRPATEAEPVVADIAAELTRIGQIRSARPFAVTVIDGETRLLVQARQIGIGLHG